MEYNKFLESLGIMPESNFVEVMELFPNIDIDFDSLFIEHDVTQEGLACAIFEKVLEQWDYVYIDEVDWENKTIYLWDVQSMLDLKEIQETFPLWTIGNYEETVKNIKENEEDEKASTVALQKEQLFNKLKKLSVEELETIVKIHDNSK